MAAPGSVTALLPTARGPVDEASSPLMQAGRRAWAVIGLTIVALAVLWIVVRVEIVAVPLVIALLPAAALMWPVDRLRSTGVPSALSAALVLLAAIAIVVVAAALAAPPITAQLGVLGSAVQDALTQVQSWLSRRPLGVPALQISQLGDRASQLALGGGVTQRVLGVADVAVHGITEVIIGLLALFFYLKDGRRIGGWINGLFAARWRADVERMSVLGWEALGGYVRGQLIIAAADGATVALGLALLRVPLAAVLGSLVAFFALFPIVGAFVGGTLAVLVAFANGGVVLAVAVLALLVSVLHLEAHVLSPLVLGRTVRLHPLAVIVALSCGAVLHGVVGALIAVPFTACAVRVASYLRSRTVVDQKTDNVADHAAAPATGRGTASS